MSKFPIVQEMEEKQTEEPFNVDYNIKAKGWEARGAIKYDPTKEKTFWRLLQMTVESVMKAPGKDEPYTIINESYTDGFSRYLSPVKSPIKEMEEKER